jgi:hypothetical protein
MKEIDLFKGINKEHILRALQIIDTEGYPPMRRSTNYDLVENYKCYPPKYVMSLAGYVRDKTFIHEEKFSGGEYSPCFEYLRKLGFIILPKEESDRFKPARQNSEVKNKYMATTIAQPVIDFFTKEDFSHLSKFVGQRLDREKTEMVETYNHLSQTYKKVEHWALQVGNIVFPNGRVTIVKKPTNQASNFEAYLWAKIYPTKELYEWRTLAFTVTFSNREDFCVKIDTVSLNDGEPLRKRYLEYLGDFFNSPIVKIFKADEILSGNWDTLISKSVNAIKALQNDYNRLLAILGYKSQGVPDQSIAPTVHEPLRLNQILYGPPGTGKTYNSIDIAVRVANGASSPDRSANKKEFDRLKKEGRIEFVTFHQNYSYEDFMFGIRPDLDEASILRFKRVEGVFYRLCKKAEQNYLQSQHRTEGLKPFEEVFAEFIAPIEKEGKEIEVNMLSGNTAFWITNITSSSMEFRKQSGGTDHTLSIETTRALYNKTRDYPSGLNYYYEALLSELWELGKIETPQIALEHFVLIIDEINRANISRVFGELITLLEHDKRIGRKNELRITLPNGEKDFGIPPNLYLIGTMNTADKSIALVDIALRRRFEFVGYFPDYSKLEESDRDLLKHINKEIFSRKKSADYLIGHAYFMEGHASTKVLKNKVLPLLMEYFSGKVEIVEDIFKESGWRVQYDIEKYDWQITQMN